MAGAATPKLLAQMQALYPKVPAGQLSPWSVIVATAFSASNIPEAVPIVFNYASEDLKTEEEKLLLARMFRDGLFKSGMLSGYPKAINALVQLRSALPTSLCDKTPMRDTSLSVEALNKTGQELFDHMYGDTAQSVQNLLVDIYPDFEYFSTTFAYGYTYSFSKVLSPIHSSFAIVAALIASDTPLQIGWHLNGALRNGATLDEVKAVRQISIEVARAAGVTWRNTIPDI